MTRNIPSNATRIKDGLLVVETNLVVANRPITKWELFAENGWCFYDLTIPENYDEDGNLRAETERVYYRYTLMRKDEQYVTDNIISVPIQDGFEIVN